MNSERDDLSKFLDVYLDYLENARDEPPALEDLPEEQRLAAESFIRSIKAARGVDPYASRPSIEQLLARRSHTTDQTGELGEVIQNHLRFTVDHKAVVTTDPASDALGLASTWVILARGMRLRVVPEMTSENLDFALTNRAGDIARVFSAFPETHAVLYTTMGQSPRAVVVDRGDVQGAIETPSGEIREPRLRRSVADSGMACEAWLRGLIPEFQPLSTDLLESTAASESALDPHLLARKVVGEVSTAGARARIPAKQDTWRDFGDLEAERLADLVHEAQLGQLSEEDYKSRIDELVARAA